MTASSALLQGRLAALLSYRDTFYPPDMLTSPLRGFSASRFRERPADTRVLRIGGDPSDLAFSDLFFIRLKTDERLRFAVRVATASLDEVARATRFLAAVVFREALLRAVLRPDRKALLDAIGTEAFEAAARQGTVFWASLGDLAPKDTTPRFAAVPGRANDAGVDDEGRPVLSAQIAILPFLLRHAYGLLDLLLEAIEPMLSRLNQNRFGTGVRSALSSPDQLDEASIPLLSERQVEQMIGLSRRRVPEWSHSTV